MRRKRMTKKRSWRGRMKECRRWINPLKTDKVKVKFMLRLAVGLGLKPQSGAQEQKFVTVTQLRICWCGEPSLTRRWVSRLQFLLVLASAVILRTESRGTHYHILLSQIRDSPNLEGQVPVFISPRYSAVQLYSQALGSLFDASQG
jgi:hypothetical protein